MKKIYRKALAEVNIVLENSEDEIKNNIPEKFKKFIINNMDKTHKIDLKQKKGLIEQNLLLETRQILALIYRDYICTKEEREMLLLHEKEERDRIEKEKQEKYNIDFEKILENRKQKNIIEKSETENETALIEMQEEKWYKKILNKILHIFKRK